MSDDEGFVLPKTALKRAQKGDIRRSVAKEFGIVYSPEKGQMLTKHESPRLSGAASTRIKRAPSKAFNPLSPKGTKHGKQSTSTNAAKYCSYGHAMAHFPRTGTLIDQARNIDSVLSVCMDDFSTRLSVNSPGSYERSSNRLFWKDASRLLDMYIDIIKEMSYEGINVGPYLDELRKYTHGFQDAQRRFFTDSERSALKFLQPGTVMSPVKMASFDDE